MPRRYSAGVHTAKAARILNYGDEREEKNIRLRIYRLVKQTDSGDIREQRAYINAYVAEARSGSVIFTENTERRRRFRLRMYGK